MLGHWLLLWLSTGPLYHSNSHLTLQLDGLWVFSVTFTH